jgi:GGDEF domain-containing protein
VIRPRTNLSDGEEFVRALDTLIGRGEINQTFAKIAESKLVRNNAIESLAINRGESQYYSTSAAVIDGTNILTITAHGNNPQKVQEFANTVGSETVDYIGNLYDVFELEPLDNARLPGDPENIPAWQIITVFILIGLGISLGLILLVSMVLRTQDKYPEFSIIDPGTGAYNREYFSMRLGEELGRKGRTQSPFAMSLIRFAVPGLNFDQYEFEGWTDDMETIKQRLELLLNDGDVLARYDPRTFSVLLLDLEEEDYKNKVNEIQAEIRNIDLEYFFKGRNYPAISSLGFVYYYPNNVVTEPKEIVDFVIYAIDKAGKFNSSRTAELKIDPQGEIEEVISEF